MDTKSLHIKLTKPLAEAFRKACKAEGEAQATIARGLIREWVDDHERTAGAVK